MNNYVCSGNLTRDPEVVSFSSGNQVIKFGIAVNGRPVKENGEVLKDSNGRVIREVVFWDCEMWGEGGASLAQYSKKGDMLILGGEIKEESWEDKATQAKRNKKVLRVKEYSFGGGSNGGGSENSDEPKEKKASRGRPKKEKPPVTDVDEPKLENTKDIPF